MRVIDGTNLLLGRLGAKVAKYLLSGEEVVIVNAERVAISGRVDKNVEKYMKRRERKDKANPEHSYHLSRRPDLFVKKALRGMLPFKRSRGREAFRKLRVYIGEPKQFKDAAKENLSNISCVGKSRYADIGEICRRLGYRGV